MHLERHFGARRVGHKTDPRSCNVPSLSLHQGLWVHLIFFRSLIQPRLKKNLEKSTCWLWELQVGKQPEAEGEELSAGGEKKGLRLQHK